MVCRCVSYMAFMNSRRLLAEKRFTQCVQWLVWCDFVVTVTKGLEHSTATNLKALLINIRNGVRFDLTQNTSLLPLTSRIGWKVAQSKLISSRYCFTFTLSTSPSCPWVWTAVTILVPKNWTFINTQCRMFMSSFNLVNLRKFHICLNPNVINIQ